LSLLLRGVVVVTVGSPLGLAMLHARLGAWEPDAGLVSRGSDARLVVRHAEIRLVVDGRGIRREARGPEVGPVNRRLGGHPVARHRATRRATGEPGRRPVPGVSG